MRSSSPRSTLSLRRWSSVLALPSARVRRCISCACGSLAAALALLLLPVHSLISHIRALAGYDASLSFMAHLWQPLRVYHKPLVFQLGAELAARSAHLLLLLMGFRPRTAAGGFSCWVAAAVVPAPPAAQRTAAAGNGQAATPFTARRCRIADSAAEDEGADGMHKAATASAACPRSPRLLQRASGAGGVMHQAAEQVLDDVVDIISEVSGAVAAQHPHGQPTSPRPLRAASDPLHSGSFLTQAGDMGPRSGGYASSPARATLRRAKQDSALDYELMDGAAAAMAPGSPPIPAYLPSESPGRSGSGHGNVPVVFLHGVGLGVMPVRPRPLPGLLLCFHLARLLVPADPAALLGANHLCGPLPTLHSTCIWCAQCKERCQTHRSWWLR